MDDTRLVEEFRARYNAGERFKFVFFWGDTPGRQGVTATCLSQWYVAPFDLDGMHYPTAEHYMMAEKARLFGDEEVRAQILETADPAAAKALGRRIMNFDEGIWYEHRYSIVVRGNEAKFSQNPPLKKFLLETGSRILVEASPVDPIWGIGLAQKDERATDPNQWRGLNLLGFALMEARSRLAEAPA